jgi:hypothetical protein
MGGCDLSDSEASRAYPLITTNLEHHSQFAIKITNLGIFHSPWQRTPGWHCCIADRINNTWYKSTKKSITLHLPGMLDSAWIHSAGEWTTLLLLLPRLHSHDYCFWLQRSGHGETHIASWSFVLKIKPIVFLVRQRPLQQTCSDRVVVFSSSRLFGITDVFNASTVRKCSWFMTSVALAVPLDGRDITLTTGMLAFAALPNKINSFWETLWMNANISKQLKNSLSGESPLMEEDKLPIELPASLRVS